MDVSFVVADVASTSSVRRAAERYGKLQVQTDRPTNKLCHLHVIVFLLLFPAVAVLRWGQGAQVPKSCPAPPPQIFGHCSSATGWINWFYSKFRLAVVASQMMRGQAPQIFFPRTATDFQSSLLWCCWLDDTKEHPDCRMSSSYNFQKFTFAVPDPTFSNSRNKYERYYMDPEGARLLTYCSICIR